LGDELRLSLGRSVQRFITLKIKGDSERIGIFLAGELRNGQAEPRWVFIPTFHLNPVLAGVRDLLGSSSDLTRVKVTRPASANQPAHSWTLDASQPDDETNSLWLRDGDVIEVPDKE
jgi:hypothetical protein